MQRSSFAIYERELELALKGLSLIGMEGLSPSGGGRDRRLANGVVVGSRGFVERMGWGAMACDFGCAIRSWTSRNVS